MAATERDRDRTPAPIGREELRAALDREAILIVGELAAISWSGRLSDLDAAEAVERYLHCLIPVALGDFSYSSRRKLVHAAADHGLRRLSEGASDVDVLEELEIHRRILIGHLRRHSSDEVIASGRWTDSLDRAISLASRAALRGFYREEFERRGAWQNVLDALLSD